MARLSVIPSILGVLEPYLDRAERQWMDQASAKRRPTLPLTNDGKVNVARLVSDLGLPPSYAQHFYKPEIAKIVNVIASIQGVKLIGSRAIADAEDDAAKAQIGRLRAETKRQTEGHAQSRVRVAELERENAQLRAALARLELRLQHMQRSGTLIRTAEIVE